MTQFHFDSAKKIEAKAHDFRGISPRKSFSPPYTPEPIAIVKRINSTIAEVVWTVLVQANLPKCLLPFALKHAIYV